MKPVPKLSVQKQTVFDKTSKIYEPNDGQI